LVGVSGRPGAALWIETWHAACLPRKILNRGGQAPPCGLKRDGAVQRGRKRGHIGAARRRPVD